MADDLTKDQLDGIARCRIDGTPGVALRYTQGAQAKLCEALEVEDLEALIVATSTIDARTLPLFIWAGRLHEDPEFKAGREPSLTIQEVAQWQVPYFPALAAIAEATNLALFGLPSGIPAGIGDGGGGSEDTENPPASPSRGDE